MPRRRAPVVVFAAALALVAPRRARADFAVRNFTGPTDAEMVYNGVASVVLADESAETFSLRITPASAHATGSSFAREKQLVVGGFVSDFAFRITNDPTVEVPCDGVDHASDTCSRRGGDGFAFVIQNNAEKAMGGGGGQLGYGGLRNCIAVEFDTYHDAEARDPYHNHVAVMTRGPKAPALSTHATSIGASVDVPNLSDGERHYVRIVYNPMFVPEDAMHKSFKSSAYLLDLMRDYKHGLGTLKVFVDNLAVPVLTVPINIAAFMDLDNGRAWIGFTASTGRSMQNHDVSSFTFRERVVGLEAVVS